jgi:hypothetical protein
MYKVTEVAAMCTDQQHHCLPAPATTQAFATCMQISLLQAASGKQQQQQQQSNALEKQNRCVYRARMLSQLRCCSGDA